MRGINVAMLVKYKLIASDGREAMVELLPSTIYPYQELAMIAARNRFRNYRVENVRDKNE